MPTRKPTCDATARNSIQSPLLSEDPDELEAQADELEAEAALLSAEAHALRARAKRSRKQQHQAAPAPASPPPLMTKRELARILNVSTAHLDRLAPPHLCVGDQGSKRYDLAEVRSWLAARAPAPTTPLVTPRLTVGAELDVDVDLARSGLRVVGGGAR